MILHEKSDTFRNAIRAASDHLEIREVFVEKDYWVTLFLKRLSESEYVNQVVFKGGTSLSKVHKLIDRFSEDVDLALIKTGEETGGQIKSLIKKIEKLISSGFNEVEIDNVTSKKGNYRKTVYEYGKVLDDYPGSGVIDKVILEVNSFANPVPFKLQSIETMIAQYFKESGQSNRIAEFKLVSFNVNVLEPESTLIEKILSVIRLSFFEDNITELRKKVRHFYDIYFLCQSEKGKRFIESDIFLKRFSLMFEEDKGKFNDPAKWLSSDYKDAPIIKSFDEIWEEIKLTYNSDFKDLVHGEFPDEKGIAEQFKKIIKILS